MRYVFDISDEKTLENDTVKIVVQVTGPAEEKRSEFEQRVRRALGDFLPKAEWAYSGLSVSTIGYPTFSTTASTRIAAADNDDLERRAQNYVNENSGCGVSLKVTAIDSSMPLFKRREGFAVMRQNIFKMAKEELKTLHGPCRLKSIRFAEEYGQVKNVLSNTGSSYTSSSNNAGGSSAIGSSEKIYLTATVTITDGADEPETAIVQE